MTQLFARLERGQSSDRFILKALFFAAISIALLLLITLSQNAATVVPVVGGTLQEGIVGVPRFANPVLASTRADQDVVALVYSGLMRVSATGAMEPDIAESVSVSDDGRTYQITLRRDITFHDGHPLTAEDVAFTIGLIQNPDLKSPLRGTWNDVSVNVLGEYDLEIVLEEPYAPFKDNFTLGIMPKHLWKDLVIEQLPFSQYNTEPIGSGPFSITNISYDQTGLINKYTLESFDEARTTPNLATIELHFFPNETSLAEAVRAGTITATAYLPTNELKHLPSDEFSIMEAPLPRLFAVFFNQNRSPITRDAAARSALSAAVDRSALVSTVVHGYGIPTAHPIILDQPVLSSAEASLITTDEALQTAETILRDGGWTKNSLGLWEKRIAGNAETLRVTIRTSNAPLFDAIVSEITERWRALGVEVEVEKFEQTDLVQSVIRPREFEALLFGIDQNRTEDLYPFWHSSQKSDPGLNVAQYTNIAVDRLLEDARVTKDDVEREKILREVADRITAETPAVFLFAPTIPYVVATTVTTTPLPPIRRPSDRFATVTSWYTKTDALWPFFTDTARTAQN
jgi:peptide/nickel transport system substrate-binding protein